MSGNVFVFFVTGSWLWFQNCSNSFFFKGEQNLLEQRISPWQLIIYIAIADVFSFVSWHHFTISAQVTTGVMQTRLFAGFHEDTRQVLQSLGLLRYVEADVALFSTMVER